MTAEHIEQFDQSDPVDQSAFEVSQWSIDAARSVLPSLSDDDAAMFGRVVREASIDSGLDGREGGLLWALDYATAYPYDFKQRLADEQWSDHIGFANPVNSDSPYFMVRRQTIETAVDLHASRLAYRINYNRNVEHAVHPSDEGDAALRSSIAFRERRGAYMTRSNEPQAFVYFQNAVIAVLADRAAASRRETGES